MGTAEVNIGTNSGSAACDTTRIRRVVEVPLVRVEEEKNIAAKAARDTCLKGRWTSQSSGLLQRICSKAPPVSAGLSNGTCECDNLVAW